MYGKNCKQMKQKSVQVRRSLAWVRCWPASWPSWLLGFVLFALLFILALWSPGVSSFQSGNLSGPSLAADSHVPGPELELQMNSEFWQLLSWAEMLPLSELQRQGNGVQRIIPLQSLFPMFQEIESIDSRNRQGELLEVEVRSLENNYLQLEKTGELSLVLAGETQQDPQQLNIYGELWPESKLLIWMEDDREKSFLFDELMTYQRFHNTQIEVRVHRNLRQTIEQTLHRVGDTEDRLMPDMILADRATARQLRHLFQPLSVRDEKMQESIAYLEQFAANGQFYASPLVLEPYCLLYNTDLIDFAADFAGSGQMRPQLNLTEIFAQLQEASSAKAVATEGNTASDPYFMGIGDDGLPFALLLSSFLKDTDVSETGPNSPEVSAALQYLREQGQKSLLRQVDFAGERFAKGQIATVIVRSGELQQILALTAPGNNGKAHIRIAKLPYNDLRGKQIPAYTEIWSLGILRDSAVKQQAEGLRSYLLRGAVQGQFDLARGILPSNTEYYPFYQHSRYYRLLPKGELRYTMSSEQLWEYGIAQRLQFRRIEELKQLFQSRISVLLDSDVGLSLLLADLQKQWEQEVVPARELLFLR